MTRFERSNWLEVTWLALIVVNVVVISHYRSAEYVDSVTNLCTTLDK